MKTIYFKTSLSFLLFLSLSGFSQSKKLWIEAGDKCFNQQDYSTAIVWYKKVLDDTTIMKTTSVLPYEIQLVNMKLKNDSLQKAGKKKGKITSESSMKKLIPEDYVMLRLAHAFWLNADYLNALIWYKRCVEKDIPDSRYYYALTLMNVGQYQEALDEFEKYVTSNPSNDSLSKDAQKKEAGCYFALEGSNVSRTTKVIKPETVFNEGNSSFAAGYFNDATKIIFTSARKGNVVLDQKKEDSEYLCDLYWSELIDSTWSPAINVGAQINSSLHEGASFATENALYFTRWSDNNPQEAAIWRSNKLGDMFFKPQMLNQNVNEKGFKSAHPFVSPDGKKLFYSSNRPGGKGGMDLWMCDIDDSGNIGEPVNLGQPVNTEGDEVTPFLHGPSGTFYFSSNGHTGLGGLDIYKSEYNPLDIVFGQPVNLNEPLNSSKDDSYFVMEKSGASGFFTSDREDCPGGNCYKIYQFQSTPVTFDVSGIVIDAKTKEPIAGALVSISNVKDQKEIYFVICNEKGEYFQKLKPNTEYFLKAQKNQFFVEVANLVSGDDDITMHYKQDFLMDKISKGEIEIQGIEYDFNSAALRPASMQNLDKIAELLKLNGNLSVDIEANTDSRGNDSYNMKLSQSRAQTCVDYLISKGIDSSRLRSVGYGETNPLITDSQIKKIKPKSPEWDAAHQKNRRTAFRINGESEIKIISKGM